MNDVVLIKDGIERSINNLIRDTLNNLSADVLFSMA